VLTYLIMKKTESSLSLRQLAQTSYGTADRGSSCRTNRPCTTSNSFPACTAMPDANSSSLDRVLPAESACVSCVLRNFHLFNLFTQGSTIAGTVFTRDSDFLGAFCHLEKMGSGGLLVRQLLPRSAVPYDVCAS